MRASNVGARGDRLGPDPRDGNRAARRQDRRREVRRELREAEAMQAERPAARLARPPARSRRRRRATRRRSPPRARRARRARLACGIEPERGLGGFDDAKGERERSDIALHLPRTPCRVTVCTRATRVMSWTIARAGDRWGQGASDPSARGCSRVCRGAEMRALRTWADSRRPRLCCRAFDQASASVRVADVRIARPKLDKVPVHDASTRFSSPSSSPRPPSPPGPLQDPADRRRDDQQAGGR